MKISTFWEIMPRCSPLKTNRRFGGTCRFHLHGRIINQARNQHETGNKQGKKIMEVAFLKISL
jgi:hypothetical protein